MSAAGSHNVECADLGLLVASVSHRTKVRFIAFIEVVFLSNMQALYSNSFYENGQMNSSPIVSTVLREIVYICLLSGYLFSLGLYTVDFSGDDKKVACLPSQSLSKDTREFLDGTTESLYVVALRRINDDAWRR